MIDALLNSDDFKNFFFHQARGVLRSRGTEKAMSRPVFGPTLRLPICPIVSYSQRTLRSPPTGKSRPVDPSTGRREFSR